MTANNLHGLRIVVTRPAHQANSICDKFQQAGAKVVRFPVLGITESSNSEALKTIVSRLREFDIAIFISPNAVDFAIKLIEQYCGGIPTTLALGVVGRASANALQQHGYKATLVPEKGFNSEALLALPQLQQIRHKKIVIFRGEGGRELLAQTLRERGASVEYAECYRRIKPQTDNTELLQKLSANEVDLIIVTSNEGLQNLVDMLGAQGRAVLLRSQLLVVSERAIELAKSLGFTRKPLLAAQPDDEGVINSVMQWQQQRHDNH